MAASGVDWDVCEQCADDDGIGVRLPDARRCWAHANEHELGVALEQFGEGGLDARGVPITADLLARILDAAPEDPQRPDQSLLAKARFDRATFGDRASFAEVAFGDQVSFDGATFGNSISFWHATFGDQVSFDGATFGNHASFYFVTFGNNARFVGVAFGDHATFEGVAFGHLAGRFDGAVFGDHATFAHVSFGDAARFDGSAFGDHAKFDLVAFGNPAGFEGATFGDLARLGPILVVGSLNLQRVTFGRSPDLAISAARVRCQQARFPDGGHLRIRWAEIALDGVTFDRPSVLTSTPPFNEFGSNAEAPLIESVEAAVRTYRTEQPRLVCLAGCDLNNLVLDGCDLRACCFTGAHNLAALHLEGATILPTTPQGWWHGRALPPVWRWTRRLTIAEEHHWRQRQPKSAGWRGARQSDASPFAFGTPYAAAWHHHRERGAPFGPGPASPAEIAAVYRALRKGLEDNGDEPGAADFYYGEMEMRRHDPARPIAERVVVMLYWLVAGYALRASRALAWLAGVLVVATVLLATVGLTPHLSDPTRQAAAGSPDAQRPALQPPAAPNSNPVSALGSGRSVGARLGTAVLVAVEGAVFRSSDQALTYTGRVIQLVLRVVGPVLLGLAALSIRGRVKR